jgi:hypothetical protein
MADHDLGGGTPMKKLALAALMATLGTAAFAADPVVGTWKTKPDDNGNFGHVRVKPCGPAFCGTLVKAFDGVGQGNRQPQRRPPDRLGHGRLSRRPVTTMARSIRPTATRPTTFDMQLSGNKPDGVGLRAGHLPRRRHLDAGQVSARIGSQGAGASVA